jgi:acetate kinase
MKILTLNTGSSSLKYQLSVPDKGSVLAEGLVERIGEEESQISQWGPSGRVTRKVRIADQRDAFRQMVKNLIHPKKGALTRLSEVEAVGHRVVHGGDRFYRSVAITPKVLSAIRGLGDLAPLHNPLNVLGIEIARELLPKVPHVAVFDTAFHQTMPRVAYTYALPLELSEKHHIRRYGFHGSSHRYVSSRVPQLLGRPMKGLRVITCHLGNGCSMAAIKDGKSVDTTMGFTPLEGLVMGTRSGDIDPALIFHLVDKAGISLEEVQAILNERSGVLGVSGLTNDEGRHRGKQPRKRESEACP